MEIIIEIKQFNPGRIAFNPFIGNNRSYMVFPFWRYFYHRKCTFRLKEKVNVKKNQRNTSEIGVPTEHFDQF